MAGLLLFNGKKKNVFQPDLHGRVSLLRQPLQVFARLDPDGHGLVDLLDGLVMLPLDLGSVASGRKVSI